MFRLHWIIGLFCAFVTLGGCIVTDKIEFDTKINMPAELVELEPNNDTIVSTCEDTTLTAYIWEPDAEDESSYDVRLKVRLNPFVDNISPTSCNDIVAVEPEEIEQSDQGTGVYLRITCEFTLPPFVDRDDVVAGNSYIYVTMIAMDRARTAALGGTPSASARTLEITWLLDLLPEADCISP